ncbi:MAG: TlpA family protein disulfide reductase [Actinomycetota bacterium]|nr:TlpA family protein disulfide reductase [Actinomycetota bacterium]
MLLAAVFAIAGVAKLLDQPGSRSSLAGFGVPAGALPAVALLLPLAEIAVAISLIPPGTARWGALAGLVLLAGFMAGIGNALRRGRTPDCHCFGQLHSAPAGRSTLARNAVLGVLAAVVLLEGPGPSLSAWISDRTAAELAAVSAAIAALLLAAYAASLWLERRRLRDELDAAHSDISRLPAGLPAGARAPEFSLPDLSGQIHTLESLCANGRPLILAFVSPDCGPCQRVLPELGRWQAELPELLTVAVLTIGTAEQNRPAAAEHGVSPVIVQEDVELLIAYRIHNTPSAVVVTPEGRIASAPAEGLFPIESLIRLALRRDLPGSRAAALARSSV